MKDGEEKDRAQRSGVREEKDTKEAGEEDGRVGEEGQSLISPKNIESQGSFYYGKLQKR